MTKEQIEKHGEIIKWWVDHVDKGVWFKLKSSETWTLTHRPEFFTDFIYVQNDEYAELRKALVEGKQLQHLTQQISNTGIVPNSERWEDIYLLHQHLCIR